MCFACVFVYTLLKRETKRSSYPFLKQTVERRGPEVLRGQSSAHSSGKQGGRQNLASRTKKGPKKL